ncbi:hypothetical protein M2251_000218 [Rhodococcus erythropolis]|nr:hypothetical protein [Rhodococcus erythropolis]
MACCLLIASLFRSVRTRFSDRGRSSFNDIVIEAERHRAELRAHQ